MTMIRFIAITLLALAMAQSTLAQDKRFLLPIPIGVSSPGAHGSVWTGEFTAYNAGRRTVRIETSNSLCVTLCPTGRWDVAVGETVSIFSEFPTILRIPSNGFSDPQVVPMNARIFDISRLSYDRGTELPIVAENEFRSGTLHLIGVPSEPGFRNTLRIYDWDGGEPRLVTVRMLDQRTGVEIGVRQVLLEQQVHGGGYFDFGYAQLDLGAVIPIAVSAHKVRFEIAGSGVSLRLWGFVSVTHNETQRVTLITPQPL